MLRAWLRTSSGKSATRNSSAARSMWVALAMFALPAIACFVLVQVYPDLIHTLMDNRQIAAMERMYDPAAERLGRDSG
ncbi:hypothetical protein, partial [Enterobacter hormaechei]|uniref:hypothetical protein n=1 Tax=Enterobacter hormaechei TaxID=158836 RepID=UPI00403B24EC